MTRAKVNFILFGFILSLFTPIPLLAKMKATKSTDKFAIAAIPENFAEKADAVVRLEKITFSVESPKKATENIHRVVSIFNSKGRNFGIQVVYYDKFRKIKKFKGRIRDSQGKIIRKLKKSDTRDRSATSDYSLYEDHRVLFAELYHSQYPYTVEFEYEIERNGLINWRTWYPQVDEIPVEQTTFEVSAPTDLPVRHKARGLDLQPEITQNGNRKIYRWEAKLLSAPELEPHGPSWREQMPSVIVAPAKFQMEGYSGNMASWEAFGRWYYKLSQGRAVLPDAAKRGVAELIAATADPRERIRKIYQHLQKNTRYVSIQLGIGGWQPFDASYVFERKYGDCKALTNYMLAMLKYADIEAHPALVLAGSRQPDIIADFPSNQFNHAILCVPLQADTVWLECTSQIIPFGHLGTFTEDRNVLVVMPSGGKLVRTPKSQSPDNMQIRKAQVAVLETGDAIASVRTVYTGNQQDRVRSALAKKSARERNKWLRNATDLPSFQITSVDFSEADEKANAISLPVNFKISKYGTRSNRRLFLKPNLLEKWKRAPRKVTQRTQPVHIAYSYIDIDTIRYQIPAGFSVETAPQPVEILTDFGSYSASINVGDGDFIEYFRKLELRENKLPAESYQAYRDFIKQVVKADNQQIVLIKR